MGWFWRRVGRLLVGLLFVVLGLACMIAFMLAIYYTGGKVLG